MARHRPVLTTVLSLADRGRGVERIGGGEIMRIRVVPYAELRRLLPGAGKDEVLWLELPDGATVGDALRTLNIVTEERLIVGLDGAYATTETPLRAGAELTLVTPMMGG